MEDTTRRFWLDGACFFAFLFFFVVGNNGKCVSALSDSDGPLCYADLPTAPFEGMSGWDIASVCVVCGAVGRRGGQRLGLQSQTSRNVPDRTS